MSRTATVLLALVVAVVPAGCGGGGTLSSGIVARVRGTSAAGTAFVATVRHGPPAPTVPSITVVSRLPATLRRQLEASRAEQTALCPFSVSIEDDGAAGLDGTCLGPGARAGAQTVNCAAGLLTITATTGVGVRAVRLGLSDGRTVTSAPIIVPDRSVGGFYYQVVRGPAPVPRTLTLLDGSGRVRATLRLPRVVGCTTQPLHFLPGGTRTLATGRLPHGGGYSVIGERYRFLGRVYFTLATNTPPGGQSSFNPQQTPGPLAYTVSIACGTPAEGILVGLLRTRNGVVTVAGPGGARALHVLPIAAALHAGGRLVVGVLPPGADRVTVRAGDRTLLEQPVSSVAADLCAPGEGVVEFSVSGTGARRRG